MYRFTNLVPTPMNNKDQVYIYSAERGALREHQSLLKGLQAFQDYFYLSLTNIFQVSQLFPDKGNSVSKVIENTPPCCYLLALYSRLFLLHPTASGPQTALIVHLQKKPLLTSWEGRAS